MTTGLLHKNVELRIRQFEIAADPERSLQIARWFISGKIRNSRTLLRRHLTVGRSVPDRHPSPQPTENGGPEEVIASEPIASGLDTQRKSVPDPPSFPLPSEQDLDLRTDRATDINRERLLESLSEFRRKAESASSAETLLGLEGLAAKTYFAGFFELLNRRHDFNVHDRNRRPPRDPVNAVLSFVYSLLVKELTVVLQSVGFDPMLGFFHKPRYGRPSLALDVAEEYRPLLADSTALMAFNNGELDHTSFLERAGAVTLTEAGRKAVIAAFERRLEQEVTHPTFGYRVSYRRILEVQARLLARTITGELPEYVPFCTR